MSERKFEKVVAPKLVKWERIGEVVEGIYEGVEEQEVRRKGEAFNGRTHTVTTDAGEKVNFYEPADLGVKMKVVQVGDYVRVTFTHEVKATKRGYSAQKMFNVEVAV